MSSTTNDIIRALGELIEATLVQAYAPAECACDLTLWDTDVTKLAPEATPFVQLHAADSELLEAGNGWPQRSKKVTAWIYVKASADLADTPGTGQRPSPALGIGGRLTEVQELLERTLIGTRVLAGVLVEIKPDGIVQPAYNAQEGSAPLPLLLEYPTETW